MGSTLDYLSAVGKNRTNPKDPFTHAKFLLEQEEDILESRTADNKSIRFSKLINKMVLLGSINNDKLMRFYQNDVVILTMMYDLASRDKLLRPAFAVMYYGFVGELSMTRTHKGIERLMQATVGTNYSPQGEFGGYGEDLFGDPNHQESPGGFGGMIGGLLPKKGSYGNRMRDMHGR